MLREHRNVSQVPGEDRRKWFSDDYFDLIVWFDPSNSISGFELCYDLKSSERAIVWNPERGVQHMNVDSGDTSPIENQAPVMSRAGPVPYRDVLVRFQQRSRRIDYAIYRFVIQKLTDQPDCPYTFEQLASGLVEGSGGEISSSRVGMLRRLFPKKRQPSIKAPVPTRDQVFLPEELLKKVKRIEIHTRKIVDEMMGGKYKSHFKGHGVQFSEHRVYMPGDDVRHIDWKVSARTREPLIKKFDEERELTVLLVVDVSASEGFSSEKKLKSEMIAEIGGMLAYAATHTGDKVGAMLFTDEVEKTIVPKKGRNHVLRIVRDLLGYAPRSSGTDLAGALDSANRVLKHAGVVFVISDFIADDYENSLKRLSRRNDVVALWVRDQREWQIPSIGSLLVLDPETGSETMVDTGSYRFKNWLRQHSKKYEEKTRNAFKKSRVEVLELTTRDDYGNALVRFFQRRKRSAR